MDIVDFHSHILPRADHGSTSVEVTTAQLKSAKEYGVSRIIATPHFYPQSHLLEDFLKRREKSFERLREIKIDDMPEIRLGAEVLVCENIYRLPGLENLCISGTNTILLELPFTKLEDRHRNMIAEVSEAGFDVVLAHADRYDGDFISSMLDLNISLQINASAFCHLFISKYIKQWIKDGRVCAIGSDIHGPSVHAYPRFDKARKKLGKSLSDVKKHSDSIWDKSK